MGGRIGILSLSGYKRSPLRDEFAQQSNPKEGDPWTGDPKIREWIKCKVPAFTAPSIESETMDTENGYVEWHDVVVTPSCAGVESG